jgi:hypothetical protein
MLHRGRQGRADSRSYSEYPYSEQFFGSVEPPPQLLRPGIPSLLFTRGRVLPPLFAPDIAPPFTLQPQPEWDKVAVKNAVPSQADAGPNIHRSPSGSPRPSSLSGLSDGDSEELLNPSFSLSLQRGWNSPSDELKHQQILKEFVRF